MGRTAEEPLMNRHEALPLAKSLTSEPKSKDTARRRNLWAKLDAPDFALMVAGWHFHFTGVVVQSKRQKLSLVTQQHSRRDSST